MVGGNGAWKRKLPQTNGRNSEFRHDHLMSIVSVPDVVVVEAIDIGFELAGIDVDVSDEKGSIMCIIPSGSRPPELSGRLYFI